MRLLRIVLLAVLAVAVTVKLGPAVENKREVTCVCAIFSEKGADKITGTPLLTTNFTIEAQCDEADQGVDQCGLLCYKIPEIPGERLAPKENHDLCQAIWDTPKPLRPSVYSKTCNAKFWTYTGPTVSDDFCCIEGKRDICLAVYE